eukprot:4375028-Prymnesium_polylepis.1
MWRATACASFVRPRARVSCLRPPSPETRNTHTQRPTALKISSTTRPAATHSEIPSSVPSRRGRRSQSAQRRDPKPSGRRSESRLSCSGSSGLPGWLATACKCLGSARIAARPTLERSRQCGNEGAEQSSSEAVVSGSCRGAGRAPEQPLVDVRSDPHPRDDAVLEATLHKETRAVAVLVLEVVGRVSAAPLLVTPPQVVRDREEACAVPSVLEREVVT